MDMDMDVIFHIHGNPGRLLVNIQRSVWRQKNKNRGHINLEVRIYSLQRGSTKRNCNYPSFSQFQVRRKTSKAGFDLL